MATYKKTFQETGSTLTINYPSGLFAEIIDDPRDYYKINTYEEHLNDSENPHWDYPEILLIPKNGSIINRYTKCYARGGGRTWYRDSDGNLTRQDDGTFWREGEWRGYLTRFSFWGSGIYQIDDGCGASIGYGVNQYQLGADSDFPGLEMTQEILQYFKRNNYKSPEDLAPGEGLGWWEVHATVTITGQVNQFTSNAQFYCGDYSSQPELSTDTEPPEQNSPETGQIIISSYFPDEQQRIGSIVIEKDGEVREMYAVDQLQKANRVAQGKSAKFSTSAGMIHASPNSTAWINRYDDVSEEQYMADGFLYNFPITSNHEKNLTLIKSEINVNPHQLIVISKNPAVIEKTKTEQNQTQTKIQTRDSNLLLVDGLRSCLKYGKDFSIFGHHFISHKKLNRANNFKFETLDDDNTYLNKFAMYDNRGELKILPDLSKLPVKRDGILLFPLFCEPKCTYVHLKCDSASDPSGAIDENFSGNVSIMEKLQSTYGKYDLKAKTVKDWRNTSLESELSSLRNSKSKLKILLVNCHGGRLEGGSTYGALSRPHGVNYNIDASKYLLSSETSNEDYFYIYVTSCFGGGFFEDELHTYELAPNYTSVIPSSSFSGNYLIQYADCSVSPAWGFNYPLGTQYYVSDIFDHNSSDGYGVQAARVNSKVKETRNKNVNLLVDFLRSHKSTLYTMVDVEKTWWTDQTYANSLNYANNLIMFQSEHVRAAQLSGLRKTYPILFLTQLLFEVATITQFDYVNDPTLTEQEKKSRFYMYDFRRYADAFTNVADEYNNCKSTFWGQNLLMAAVDTLNPVSWMDERKEELKRTIDFFWDLHKVANKMRDNSSWARELNHLPDWSIVGYLIDDQPGMIFGGSQAFNECRFPFYPGWDNSLKMEDRDIENMKFTATDDWVEV